MNEVKDVFGNFDSPFIAAAIIAAFIIFGIFFLFWLFFERPFKLMKGFMRGKGYILILGLFLIGISMSCDFKSQNTWLPVKKPVVNQNPAPATAPAPAPDYTNYPAPYKDLTGGGSYAEGNISVVMGKNRRGKLLMVLRRYSEEPLISEFNDEDFIEMVWCEIKIIYTQVDVKNLSHPGFPDRPIYSKSESYLTGTFRNGVYTWIEKTEDNKKALFQRKVGEEKPKRVLVENSSQAKDLCEKMESEGKKLFEDYYYFCH